MRKLPTFFVLLAGACGRLTHVDPHPRSPDRQRATVVRVYSTCVTQAPFKTGEPGDPHQFDEDIEWIAPRWSTGVILSEKHVATAGHATSCPDFPGVAVKLPDGRHFRMDEDRNDLMFSDGKEDRARLVLVGAYDRFEIGAVPPYLGVAHLGDMLCAQYYGRDEACGVFDPINGHLGFDAPSTSGDSGAPVYNQDGELVGIVTKGAPDGSYTEFQPLDTAFLSGT
ncbi:MAG: trypsin-like peptidase domain-containing protein [Planctomycetes bacterium]|nr:trypsin-like peptidase domain-containing protein [Planctomycetota bacterium]